MLLSDPTAFCACSVGQQRRHFAQVQAQSWRDERQRLAARVQQEREARYGAHLPKRYAGLTFDTLLAVAGDDRAKRVAVAGARRYLSDGDLNGHEGLLLHGPTEMGKTGIAVAVARHFLDAGKSVLWLEVFRFLRLAFTDAGAALIDQAETVDLLVLDNIGTPEGTDGSDQVTLETRGRLKLLFEVINHRSSNVRPMVLTSNLTPAELAAQLGPAIASRLYEACAAIEVTGRPLRRLAP